MEQTSPFSIEKEVSRAKVIELHFSAAMDRESVEENFSLKQVIAEDLTASPVAGLFQWSNGDRIVRFQAYETFLASQEYQLELAKESQSTGGFPLHHDFRIIFTTTAQIYSGVVSISPTSGETNVSRSKVPEIRFSRSMDRDSVEEAFSVVPVLEEGISSTPLSQVLFNGRRGIKPCVSNHPESWKQVGFI